MLLLIALASATPNTFQHQGRLVDVTGVPVNDSVTLTFAIHQDAVAGELVDAEWSDALSVDVVDGYYSVVLGPVDDAVWHADALWMEVFVDGAALRPRSPLGSVPFSRTAANAAGSQGVLLTSPDGASCVRLSLQNGATAADSTPVDCITGAELGLSQVGGAWQLGDGQFHPSCLGYFEDPLYQDEGSGQYRIDPDGDGTAVTAYCDMTPSDGGWTLIAINTVDSSPTLFRKSFAEYAAGWGDYSNVQAPGAWIGLEAMHHLTVGSTATMRAVTNTRTYTYPGWNVDSSASDYTLYVPSSDANPGNAHNGMRYANGRKFSAYDRDNDLNENNCASQNNTGWWYNNCWYTQYASSNSTSSYWNEPASHPTDNYTSVRMWLR